MSIAVLTLAGGASAAMYNNPSMLPRFRHFAAARSPAPGSPSQFNAYGGYMPYFGMGGGGPFGGAGGPFGPPPGGIAGGTVFNAPNPLNGMGGLQGGRPF